MCSIDFWWYKNLGNHKTSELVSILKSLKLEDKKLTILVAGDGNRNLDLSARNLKNVHLVSSKNASTYDLIDCEILILDQDSVNLLSENLKD